MTNAGHRQLMPREREDCAPLSFAQRRLWFFDQLEPGSSLYNVPLVFELDGPLDMSVLERSLEEILRRHDVLRAVFRAEGGEPRQCVRPARPVTIDVDDLSEVPPRERQSEASARMLKLIAEPFDLSEGPLFRATILRLSPSSHVLVGVAHHIVYDGWSAGIVFDELATLYEAFGAGQPSPLPDLPVQYADYARQQRERLRGDVLERELSYWTDQLRAPRQTVGLPTDRPRPLTPSGRGRSESVLLPGYLADALQALSRRQGVSFFMTLVAAYAVLLHRYTGENDIIIGMPIANRTREDVKDVVGLFVNVLPLRLAVSPATTFQDFLTHVRCVASDAYDHQDLPFEKLVEELQPERDSSHTPIVRTVFNFLKMPPGFQWERRAGELTVRFRIKESDTAKFDLMMEIASKPEGVVAKAVYATDLFEQPTIGRMLGHLQTLLAAVTEASDRPISELPLLTTAERRRLIASSATIVDYPRDQTVHEVFATQVAETPDAVALVSERGELTYAELNERAHHLAHVLQGHGVQPKSRVAVCIERSPDLVVALLAVLKVGAVYVPLDAEYPAERLKYMMQTAGVVAVVTASGLVRRLPFDAETVICVDRDIIACDTTCETAFPSVAADDLAYVMYTSGSTGRPKGVAISHRGIVRLVKGPDYVAFRASEVFLQFAPVSFDASTFEIWGSLLNGARLVLMPPGAASLHEIEDVIRRHGVTTLWLTSALFRQVIDERPSLLAPVRQLVTGGDVVPVTQAQKALALFPRCRFVNGYGPTESTTFACCYDMRAGGLNGTSVPIGRPIANTEAYILDRHRELVPVGVAGELYLGGDGLAQGYLNEPALTAERFVAHPFSERAGDRLYRTGDLVRRREDGALEFLGRVDRQVKLRGFRIELEEVEAVMTEDPSVRQAAVVTCVDEQRPGEMRLVAYVEPTTDGADPAVLREMLRDRLPGYMVPSSFVVLDELPRTASGKLDRRALIPPKTDRLAPHGSVAPRTAVERRLCELWRDVLAVDDIGVEDDFFDLGGHSLLAVRLIAEIEDVFHLRLPLSSLFEGATIEQQATLIERGDEGGDVSLASPLVQIKRQGTRPPLYLVHGIGGEVLGFTELARQLDPDQPVSGFRHVDPDGITSVEETARRYVDALLRLDDRGVYQLGGYSAGGVIAYEMAQQLRRQGHDVTLLAMLDCSAPHVVCVRPPLTPKVLLRIAKNLAYWPIDDDFFRSGFDEMSARVRSKARGWRSRLASFVGLGNGRVPDIRDSLSLWKFPESVRPFLESYVHALNTYQPQPYAGTITVVRARTLKLWSPHPPDLYWGRLAEEGVDLEIVPGAHDTMLTRPHVDRLAAALQKRLRAPESAA